ncbi:brain tumor protein [Caerostris darwini]|uniref:Brain tumor protein n=1 Tax=Caerostris darwini TaxID=1538125 RepID=A0AAV4W2K4_9ARAC|nr:brain tumor protein [Caerostris darwini]
MASQDMALTACDEDVTDGCHLCKSKFEQPRVLNCLHVFCEDCLKKRLSENGYVPNALECPDCGQETELNGKGISALPLDYVACNRIDLKAMEKTQIVCTSCKAKETAVARCTECATFLCPNCVTAHQFMRCFESHKVVSFDEMKGGGESFTTIHKPVACASHPDEVMKYFCHTCHVPICNECMIVDHKQPEHCYEKAVDAERKEREELQSLVAESKSKVQFCDEATSILDANLSDLQMQRDNVKSHIEETFQSFKALLEKQKENVLKELESVHSSQELQVMETYHNVEKTTDKIEDACKFTERLLACGNTLEILSLAHVVGKQLLLLINNTPKLDITVGISFETDEKKFEECIKGTFGNVKKPEPPVKKEDSPSSQKTSPMHSSSSFESDAFSLSTGVLTPENPLPSLDVDLANNIVAQYNLAQLAGMAERSISQNSSSATPPPLNFADLLCPTTEADVAAQFNAINNLTALAKMGSISISNGQSTLNGPITGLNLHTTPIPNSPPPGSQVMRVINTPSPIEGLETLLGSNPIVNTSSRVGSPLNGPVMNGTPLLGHGLHSPPILPPSALSPMSGQTYNPTPRSSSVKLSTMQIRCKFGQLGPGKSQFSSPHGFCLGLEEEIIVADTNNHRIQVFEKTGDFKYQFGVAGKEEGQLWYPRKVAVIRSSGKFVVCDRGSERSRMQIFTKTGHFLKKIAIRYIDIVAGLAITSEGTIVAVDSVAPTVFIISEAGDLLHWFDCSEYMREPSDIAVCAKEFYICDFKGHCVIVFSEKGKFLRRIGCENVTNFPNGIDISDAGDVLVGDSHGNRFHIVVFSRQGNLLSEFECPYVKVSRCCGLKITSEGYVVTLAKNNHHVLVLNTLYIM